MEVIKKTNFENMQIIYNEKETALRQTTVIASTDLNRIHHANFLDNNLPDKCAKLIIADPPYYKVKGDFDFVWKTFEDYLKDVEKWCLECKRILADNGTLFWYGGSKNIAYAQVIFDKHFNLINNLTWNKGSFLGLEESEGLRSFAPCTERILMYSKESQYGTRDLLKKEGEKISPFAKIIKDEMSKKNIPKRELTILQLSKNNQTTGWISNKLSGSEIPTREQWDLLTKKFNIENKYDCLLRERNNMMDEIKKTFRPFNNHFNLQEVLNFSNEAVKVGNKYDHDTVKPETLTRALILTCSRENDLVVVPFAGSGTECAMSAKENRSFIGYEITEKYVKMSNKRVRQILQNPPLFAGL